MICDSKKSEIEAVLYVYIQQYEIKLFFGLMNALVITTIYYTVSK